MRPDQRAGGDAIRHVAAPRRLAARYRWGDVLEWLERRRAAEDDPPAE